MVLCSLKNIKNVFNIYDYNTAKKIFITLRAVDIIRTYICVLYSRPLTN